MKAAALLIAMLTLTAQLPIYEYLISIDTGEVTVHCDSLIYVNGDNKRLITAQCFVFMPTGNVYEVNPYAKLLGTRYRIVDAILSIDTDKDSGQMNVVIGGRDVLIQWSLVSRAGIKVLTPEGVAVLTFVAVLVSLGAVYTIINRRKYMID